METLNNIVLTIQNYMSNIVLIIALAAAGIWFSIRTGFIQVRGFKRGIKQVFGGLFSKKGEAGNDGMSSFQALATAIAAQVGTGNIAGAATAIAIGGPGAIFWMWVAAFLGMATIYSEALMAQRYKKIGDDGIVTGGPVYYIRGAFKGTFGKILAGIFAVLLIFALGFMGNAVQSNSIAASFHTAFGIPQWIMGLIVAVLAVFIFSGGMKRIAKVTETMVPFMAGAYLGIGEPDVVIDVGVSGPGVVKKALERAFAAKGDYLTVTDAAEVIKHTAYKVTRVGEIIGGEVADRLGLPFGVADLSLAPTPAVGDSVGEIFQTMGLSSIGAPGTTAILAMLNDQVKKGGVFASSHVGGLSGAFIPVSEDSAIEAAARTGALTLEKLEAMTSVCSVGLDMIAIPGDTPASTISGLIADEAAIGMINGKTTAVRVIPVPGKGVGDKAVFGGLLGEASIIRVPGGDASGFVKLGGRIPAPIHSLRN